MSLVYLKDLEGGDRFTVPNCPGEWLVKSVNNGSVTVRTTAVTVEEFDDRSGTHHSFRKPAGSNITMARNSLVHLRTRG